MAFLRQSTTCYKLFLLLTACVDTYAEECSEHNLYYLSVGGLGLAMEGNGADGVTLELYSGEDSQLWQFKRGERPGYFFIINQESGKVLDIGNEYNPVLSDRIDTDDPLVFCQQWIVAPGGRIFNVLADRPLHPTGLEPGSGLKIPTYAESEVMSIMGHDWFKFKEKSAADKYWQEVQETWREKGFSEEKIENLGRKLVLM